SERSCGMTTTWTGGNAWNGRPGGVTRRGPANETGLARSDHCGSVRTLTPSTWTRNVACPTHVIIGSARFSRSATPSLATRGRSAVFGDTVDDQIRDVMNAMRAENGARGVPGVRFAKPFIR